MARSNAISRERWVTVIVKVFQMMNEPTNSAMPAKMPKRIPTIRKFSLVEAAFSFATAAPVSASVPCGITADSRSASADWLTPSSALTSIVSNIPGSPSTCCAVALSKYADVVPPRSVMPSPYPTVPTTVSCLVEPWNSTLIVDPSAMS